MKKIEVKIIQENVQEFIDFFKFYVITLHILNNNYTAAKEMLESSSTNLEEWLLLKTFVYEKLKILTLHKICFEMLSSKYQSKYQVLVNTECNTVEIIDECARIKNLYELQGPKICCVI